MQHHRRVLCLSGQPITRNCISQYLPNGNLLKGALPPTLQKFLDSTPTSHIPSAIPLTSLRTYLTSSQPSCSVYELIRCYAKCWKSLPETAKSGLGSEYDGLVETTSRLVKASYGSMLDLLPGNIDARAIIDGNSRRSLSQQNLANFIRTFRLPDAGTTSETSIVAVALPNGPLLGLLSMAVVTRYILAPINVTSNAEQFQSDLLSTGAKTLMVLRPDFQRLCLDKNWISEHGISVYIVTPDQNMTCTISPITQSTLTRPGHTRPNGPDDTCLILFTSGTTGTKKIVPITLHSIISAVAFVGDSWRLTDQDVCLNMMPLNHIGGLIRNLFAPILLGGSTICCSAFDSNLFWDLVGEQYPTWYYASPSMHSVILDQAPSPNLSIGNSRIRMVCNAAGGLLPSLAVRLRDTFHCPVLPSYGMTECMPISTPRLDYKLDRPGTSGVSIGPELAILDEAGRREPAGQAGRVCVRGSPLFPGYMVDGKIDRSAFTTDGWFNTGDLGYMDDDGYLYITGRSKEVINRGGEIISPFEIEEAIMTEAGREDSPIHGRVSDILAFSIPHDTLQEAVAVVVVTPLDKPRIDLRQLQEAVKLSLHSTKWPVAVVYMQATPKRNGKLCRVGLGERLSFGLLRDDMTMIERHFEAYCPPADTSISLKIKMRRCHIDEGRAIDEINSWCQGQADVLTRVNSTSGFLDALLAPRSSLSLIHQLDTGNLKVELRQKLPGYLIPGKITLLDLPFPRDVFGSIDITSLDSILSSRAGPNSMSSTQPLELRIREIYANLLAMSAEDIPSGSDFFELGGDSLRAGRLLSILRKEFNARIPIDKLFTSSRVSDICNIIEEYQQVSKKEISDRSTAPPHGYAKTYSSTRIFVLFIHLLPLAVFNPLKKAFFWTIFLKTWSVTLRYWHQSETGGNLVYLLISMLVARVALAVAMPLLAILAKWTIIGRYREGLYPMWSTYHNRWWILQKILYICGMGMFKHFNWSRVLFYRLLGAKIGKGVRIEPGTLLGEYDLLDIGDHVQLDRCVCRPFAVEHNTTMYLGKIRLGRNSAAGLKTIIAPGTDLPEDTCLGVNSSSWEWKDASESNYNQLASKIPEPHWLLWGLLGLPILLVVKVISFLPWIGALSRLDVSHPPEGADLTLFLVGWFANPTRVAFHFLARIMSVLFAPMLYLFLAIALKCLIDAVFGKVKPSSTAQRRHADRFRMALMHRLIPNGNISEVTSFFGTHYEITSSIVRMLGGKVGKRVYWPGNGPSIQNFDLVDIGNDVVFGSRSHIITSDGIGCDSVRIADGAMVADRVVLMPGCQVDKQVILGSGTLTRRNDTYAPDSTWIGSKAGGPICLSLPNSSPASSPHSSRSMSSRLPSISSDDSTVDWEEKNIAYGWAAEKHAATYESSAVHSSLLSNNSSPPSSTASTPFGRAFYDKQAPYHVHGLFFITLYSVLTNIFVSVYWNVPTVVSLQFLSKIANHSLFSPLFSVSAYRPFLIMISLYISFSFLQVVFSIVALGVCICAKWMLIGQREQGDYDWDKSSYCQRWQILLTIERIRRKQVGGEDILTLLTGTHYFSTYFRLQGAKIGKDCALFAGGEITLSFTEPDLLTLGDRVAVDDASLVAHINSRGNFKLNPLVVGDRSVLRTGSRLLSGATMGDDSCLLEHTLVMAGDEVDNGTTYQGWPAEDFTGSRVNTESTETETEKESGQEIKGTRGFRQTGWFGFQVGRWFRSDGRSGRYEMISGTGESLTLA